MKNIILNRKLKYNLKIEDFEGPLDLLLYLINKNKMDIFNISLNVITDEYIEYIKKLEYDGIEVSSEFLVLASTLVNIKSKKLLPMIEEDEEEIDEEELINLVFEYKKYKEISKLIQEKYAENFGNFCKDFENIKFKSNLKDIKINSNQFLDIYMEIIERNKNKYNKNSKNVNTIIKKDSFTIEEKTNQILNYLKDKSEMNFIEFYKEKFDVNEVVTAFLGSLELAKIDKVKLHQDNIFEDIIIKKSSKYNIL